MGENPKKQDNIIIFGIIIIWILGLVSGKQILGLTGSEYEMLDEHTPNPEYSPSLHEKVKNLALYWTAFCLIVIVGYIYLRSKK